MEAWSPWTHLLRPGGEEPGVGGAGAHVAHLLPHGPRVTAAVGVAHRHAPHGARHLPGAGTQTTGRRAVTPGPRFPSGAAAAARASLTHLANDEGIQ